MLPGALACRDVDLMSQRSMVPVLRHSITARPFIVSPLLFEQIQFATPAH
jgi:hypothetical protein